MILLAAARATSAVGGLQKLPVHVFRLWWWEIKKGKWLGKFACVAMPQAMHSKYYNIKYPVEHFRIGPAGPALQCVDVTDSSHHGNSVATASSASPAVAGQPWCSLRSLTCQLSAPLSSSRLRQKIILLLLMMPLPKRDSCSCNCHCKARTSHYSMP